MTPSATLNKFVAAITMTALVCSTFAFALMASAPFARAAAPNWDTTGSYVASFDYLGTDYLHDMSLAQDSSGNLTGSGGNPAGGPHVYEWTIDSGSVSGDSIDFTVHYTMGSDATSPLTTMHVLGTIASNGTMSGTWTDNYQGGSRAGTWETTVGAASSTPPQQEGNMPNDKDQCKNGGWEQYGFPNQGQCIKFVNQHNGNKEGDGDGDEGDSDTSTVTIVKYVDGAHATAGNTGSATFNMESSWDDPAGIGTDSGTYTLSPTGYNSNNAYEADYSTHEVMDGTTVGAQCSENGPAYRLAGYSMGDSLADAQQATKSMTEPSFTDLSGNKYVIVWNEKCNGNNNGGGEGSSTVNVIIDKYVDGAQATASNASSTTFDFIADYDAVVNGNHIQGSDPYTIGPVGNLSPNAYEAKTLNFDKGADYGTHEVTGNSTTGASCQDGKQFALTGYSWGDSKAAAAAMAPTTTAPSFDNLQSDKYVIVWNDNCNNNGQGGNGDNSATSTVTIIKYVNGAHATSGNASSTSFAMQSSWADPNGIGTGSGSFNLDANGGYEAVTSPMTTNEADYATNEVLDGTTVGASCNASSTPAYRLVGYTTGNTSRISAATSSSSCGTSSAAMPLRAMRLCT